MMGARTPGFAHAATPLFVLLAVNTAQAQVPRRDSVAHRDSAARLSAVTVVGTRTERAQPLGSVRVDAATLRRTPSESPYDALRLSAGLEVHDQGQGPGFASNASLRGFSSDHSTDLALWIDGVPVNEPVNGHAEGYNDWQVLFPGSVRDIDVIRGPTSALFGNFALAGVVNVHTLERMRGSEFSLSAGSFGRTEGTAMTGYDHSASGGGVLGVRFQREDGFRPHASYYLGQVHARVVHELAPGVTIDAGAELYGGDWRSPGFLSAAEFAQHEYNIVSNDTDKGYKQRGQERVSLRVVSGSLLWRSTVYATQGRWQLFLTIPPAGGRFEGTGSQTEEEDRRTGYGATSALTWGSATREITVGIEARWDHAQYDNFYTTNRVRDSAQAQVTGRQLSGAFFVQSHADLTDRVRIDVGARFDDLATRSTPLDGSAVSSSRGVVSPKLGASLRVTNTIGVYTNVSRGFRSTDGVLIDPTLAPILAWAYEAGVKYDDAGRSVSAALFRMDVSNEQTVNPVTLDATNGGNSRRQGLELDFHLPISRVITTSGAWTVNDARYRSISAAPEDGGPPVELNGLRVYNTARYVGAAAVDIAIPQSRVLLRVSGNWVGPYSPFDEPGVVLGAYGLLHASGAVSAGHFHFELGLRNLLDRRYPELVAGDVYSPGQPRTVYFTTRVTQ
jgi:iron complex outermembrane recepter protein